MVRACCLLKPHALTANAHARGHLQTIGTELSITEVDVGDVKVQLQMLDCGGNKAQMALVEESLGPSCNWCALVYSVTDRTSFDTASEWHERLQSRRSNPQVKLRGVLVATKTDLPLTRHEVGTRASREGHGVALSSCSTCS